MNLFANTKIAIVVILLATIFVFIIFYNLLSNNPGQSDLGSQNISPFNKAQIDKAPPANLTELPDFQKQEPLSDNAIKYSFKPSSQGLRNEVIVQDNKVIFERAIPLSEDKQFLKLSVYTSQLGPAEKEIEGSKSYGSNATFKIYASKGVTLIINPFTEEIYEIHTYASTSPDDYINRWGKEYIALPENEPH